MSFNEYLIESINEGSMSDLHVEIQEKIAELIPEYLENGELNTKAIAQRIYDEWMAKGVDLSQVIMLDDLAEIAGMVNDEIQKGEY